MRFTDLRFVPLGGVGEIGVNAYLYGQDGRWLMVDLGIGFADDRLPGVDIVLPDLRFIEQQRAFLDGLVADRVDHGRRAGHEDLDVEIGLVRQLGRHGIRGLDYDAGVHSPIVCGGNP